MSKGHNHRENCKCNFCTNNRHNLKVLRPKSYSSYTRRRLSELWKKTVYCKYCGTPIFFQKFPNSGIGIFDLFGSKHKCQIKPKEYKLFKKIGIPTLRKILSKYEKNGWIPLYNVELREDLCGIFLKAETIDHPHYKEFQIPKYINISKNGIIYYRLKNSDNKKCELNFFDNDTQDFITIIVDLK